MRAIEAIKKYDASVTTGTYEILSLPDLNDLRRMSHAVREKKTGNIIANNLIFGDAKSLINKLSNGHGFNGNTPGFFCQDVKPILHKLSA